MSASVLCRSMRPVYGSTRRRVSYQIRLKLNLALAAVHYVYTATRRQLQTSTSTWSEHLVSVHPMFCKSTCKWRSCKTNKISLYPNHLCVVTPCRHPELFLPILNSHSPVGCQTTLKPDGEQQSPRICPRCHNGTNLPRTFFTARC